MSFPLSHPVESLSDNQKVCLRLVAQNMTSKEVAQRTGLSFHTVDTYLKGALVKLGASNRRDAARMLLEYEQSQKSGYPPPAVDLVPETGDQGTTISAGSWLNIITPPPLGGSSNLLSASQRTIEVLKVAAIAAVILISLTLLIAGAMQTFR